MIPPYVSDHTKSSAEKKLFRRIEALDLGEPWVCLHSLNVAEHQRQAWGELDFVILGPPGLFSVEVKGGRVSLKDGVWEYRDRYGGRHRNAKGPINQVKDTTWSLRDTLRQSIPETRGMLFGFSAAFPDIPFDVESAEWSLDFVLDSEKLASPNGVRRWLDTTIGFWQEHAGTKSVVDAALGRRILRALRPNFDLVPTMRQMTREIVERQAELSEEQYQVLDQWSGNPRLRCVGGAGSGKTMLALEAARRMRAAGRRPLLVCANPRLAAYLRSSLTESGVPAVSIIDLDAQLHETDYLVVDEGQDFLTLDRLAALDAVLAGGIGEGDWLWFMDPNHQAGIEVHPDDDATRLIEEAGPVVRLTRNYRNTRPIFDTARGLTGADLGASVAGPGPDVVFSYRDNVRSQADSLAQHLRELIDGGVLPGEIVIITMKPEATCVDALPADVLDRIAALDESAIIQQSDRYIHLTSVPDIKGLESLHVAIADVESIDDLETNRLYVAATRARASLWVGCTADLEPAVRERVVSQKKDLIQ